MITPLACSAGSTQGHSCSNPEAVGPDLMVNKLTLEVDSRYSEYAMCNVGVNNTDGHGHPCKDDTYCCFCGHHHTVSCNQTLGRENILEHFGNYTPHEHGCQKWHIWDPPPTAADCYVQNVMTKLTPANPGYWYSSLASGYCDGSGEGCTWRVASVDKIVTRECHSKVFGDLVQASAPPTCLDACGDQKTNVSSPCWTDCFYKAALGPDAGKVGGAVAGMPTADLLSAWEKPFLSVEQGGCPAQTEMPAWFAPKPPAAAGRTERAARQHVALPAARAAATAGPMNFLVMGDWGGLPAPVYVTPALLDTAPAMGQEAALQGSAFALALGDNFYESGIATDCHDKRFQKTFEEVAQRDSNSKSPDPRALPPAHPH
jgi:hypothetical protein